VGAPRRSTATPGSPELHAPERCAAHRSPRSRASVRAAISWSRRGHRPCGRYDPARGPILTMDRKTSAALGRVFAARTTPASAAVMGSVGRWSVKATLRWLLSFRFTLYCTGTP
jgi:hypothetical protein